MANESSKSTRHRFTVPNKDDTVLRWIENQSSLSTSLRMLIRWAVQEYGFADVTCLAVKRGRGRPNGTAEDIVYERGLEVFDPNTVPVQPAQTPVRQPAAPVAPSAPVMSMPVQGAGEAPQSVQPVAPAPTAKPVPVKDEPKRNIPGIEDLLV